MTGRAWTVAVSWTEAEDDELRRLFHERLLFSEIGDKLGRSKNSCIGRGRRIGLPRRKSAGLVMTAKAIGDRERKLAMRAAKKAGTWVPKVRVSRSTVARAPPRFTELREDLPAPEVKMVSLLELKARECHWPIGDPKDRDFGFCAHPTRSETDSYCEYHARIAYRPAERRTHVYVPGVGKVKINEAA